MGFIAASHLFKSCYAVTALLEPYSLLHGKKNSGRYHLYSWLYIYIYGMLKLFSIFSIWYNKTGMGLHIWMQMITPMTGKHWSLMFNVIPAGLFSIQTLWKTFSFSL
jgi:hypothetical protein